MNSLKKNLSLQLVKFWNTVLMAVPFALAWYLYYAPRMASPYYRIGNYAVIILFMLLYSAYCKIYDGFVISLNRISEMVYSQSLALLIADGILYVGIVLLLQYYFPNPVPLLLAFCGQVLLSVIWSAAAHTWYFSAFPPKKSAVIFDARLGLENLIGEYGLEKKFDIQKVAVVEDCLQNLQMLDDLDTVFLSGIHSHDRNVILKYCVEKGINVYVIPRIGDILMSGAKELHLFHLPMLRVGRYNPPPTYLFFKRLLDIVVSLIALGILSPVFLLVSVAIKAHDGGPIFYKQRRLTKDGREFDVLKFRSMRVDAEKDGVARLSTGDRDDRVTAVGKIIRKVRLDELPQLICVLTGTMTLVGPRPERPEIAAQYEQEIPEFKLRLQAKAGLTGYAQVYGKYNSSPYDKLQMDLMYIAHPSIWEDLRILFATVKILLMPESTEGVAEGTATAMQSSSTKSEKETTTVKK